MQHSETVYKIAFSMLRGLNSTTALELLRRVGSPEQFFSLDDRSLHSLTSLKNEITDSKYRQSLLDAAEREMEFIADNSIRLSFVGDSDYPARLRDCSDGPVMLHSIGNGQLNPPRSIAVVGTRHATAFGCNFVDQLIETISRMVGEVTIVSGLAYGIDIAAHKAALNNGLPTLAVVAHGLRTIYPADHRSEASRIIRQGGAIVTEYQSTATPNKGSFLARNRIVAGLADAVIIVESDLRGGAMCTARIASAYNREVMAVPGRPCDTYSRGCNRLIADHTAGILFEPEQLINALGWPVKDNNAGVQTELFKELSPMHRRIVEYLRHKPDATVNEMVVGLDIPFASLSATLFEMEMADIVITLPGGRYGLVK